MGYLMPLGFLAAGIILIVLEMSTLTFYMAALAFAALVTALATWLYPSNEWQAALVLAAMVALPLAHLLRRRVQGSKADPMSDMDKGEIATVAENAGGVLKVKYRDSLWEAVWEGASMPDMGQRAEILSRGGSRRA